ncbi:unnamed protein product [Mucor hiemalis]
MCCLQSSSTMSAVPTSMVNCNNATTTTTTSTLSSNEIKPLNLQGGQCTWCGKYGHKRPVCPLLK